MKKFIIVLLISLFLCFITQGLIYYFLDGEAGKGESNYYSSIARFQAAANPAVDIAIAGSSITGRFPGREAGNNMIGNLGSDGGPALDGMRMLTSGKIALPKFLVIETNTMYGGAEFGDSLISKNGQGLWFTIGARCPLLGASARPSAMLYSKLLKRPRVLEGDPFEIEPTSIRLTDQPTMSEFELFRFQQYLSVITELQERKVNILLVKIPAGDMNDRERQLVDWTISEFQRRFRIPYIDITKHVVREDLAFTDGVHMTPESAANVLASIVKYCNKFRQ